MRNYPTYRPEDFYVKSYREGGLTYPQFLFLHKAADEQAYNQNRFMAAIHGIDLDASAKDKGGSKTQPKTVSRPSTQSSSPMLFGDPAQYEKMSQQEREELTQKMLKHWQPFGQKMAPAQPKYSAELE
jgi:hypothetical protein